MPKALYTVNSRPSSPEREDEYNTWYDEVHLPDVCAIPGIVGAKRYKLAGDSAEGAPPEYLAVYEVDADDPPTVIAAIMTAVGEGRITLSDVLQMDPMPVMGLYIER